MLGFPTSLPISIDALLSRQMYPKNMHRKVRETQQELDDIFSWQEIRKLSKSLTFQYDKVVYLIEPTEENSRLVHEHVKVLDYPNECHVYRTGDA